MPTPSPIISASSDAKSGMFTTWLASAIRPTPAPSPSSAVAIGRPIAMNEPKLISRMTIAATIPTSGREAERALLRLLDRLAAELDLEAAASAPTRPSR